MSLHGGSMISQDIRVTPGGGGHIVESNDVKTHTGKGKGSNTVLEAIWETFTFPEC
jgi:hypothetical protein